MKVIEIIARVEDVLKDDGVRWPRLELQRWLNDAYAAIVMVRPDANTKTGEFTCAAGTRQDLTSGFSDALRLIDVVRNTATSSSKRAVRAIKRSVLDDMRPGWHGETESINIQHFMFDDQLPKSFLVYPPAKDTAKLEVIYSSLPTSHALDESALDPAGAATETINLDDIYAGPIIDFILYRAFTKDSGSERSEARAASHYSAFANAIGAKTSADQATSPNERGR